MKNILGETRFYFAQCVFNNICHYAAYDRYEKERRIKHYIALGISAVSIIILCLTLFAWETECKTLLSTLSLIGIFVTAVSMIFELYNKEDLTEFMCYHKQTAEDYKQLRDIFMDIIRQIKSGVDISLVEPKLQQCLHDYSIIGKYSLSTNNKDYKTAQKKLGLNGQGETFTWSSEEIDKFLPIELRECSCCNK